MKLKFISATFIIAPLFFIIKIPAKNKGEIEMYFVEMNV